MATRLLSQQEAPCTITGCIGKRRARGLCKTHYQQWWHKPQPADAISCDAVNTCSFSGCRRGAMPTTGLCGLHYSRKCNGRPLDGIRVTPRKTRASRPRKPCSFAGCSYDAAPMAEICTSHKAQLRAGKELRELRGFYAPDATCSYPGCDRYPTRKGLCKTHGLQNDRGKDLTPIWDQTITADAIIDFANKRGGMCISLDEAIASGKHLSKSMTWKCSIGHVWVGRFSTMKYRNQWCPTCSAGKSERICRSVLEAMFKVQFPKSYPDFLRIAQGRRGLELDGYAPSLKIGFEYQGEQHYEPNSLVDQGTVVVIRQRDATKRRLCWDAGVRLIVIHPFRETYDVEGILRHIEMCVLAADIKIPRGWMGRRPTELRDVWSPAELSVPSSVHDLAKAKGGRCLSATYVNNHTPMTWECSAGHIWQATLGNMGKPDRWCPQCNAARRSGDIASIGMARCEATAASKGGRCAATFGYKNSATKVEWKCSEGHTWMASPTNVVYKGSWCPTCHNAKRCGSPRPHKSRQTHARPDPRQTYLPP